MICNKCGQDKVCSDDKDISEFGIAGYNKDGSIRFRPNCKKCYNANRSNKKDNAIEKENVEKGLNELERKVTDVKTLQDMILATVLNKSNRVNVTYSIDKDVKQAIEGYSKETGLNYSDIVNIAVKKFLNMF